MGNDSSDKSSKLFTPLSLFVTVLFFVIVLSNIYFLYFKKDFDFLVEVACDPSKETCTVRDCSNPDDCPPNGLESFKRYTLHATDFAQCVNEDCKEVCESGQIVCELMECEEDPDFGETCSLPIETIDKVIPDEEVQEKAEIQEVKETIVPIQ